MRHDAEGQFVGERSLRRLVTPLPGQSPAGIAPAYQYVVDVVATAANISRKENIACRADTHARILDRRIGWPVNAHCPGLGNWRLRRCRSQHTGRVADDSQWQQAEGTRSRSHDVPNLFSERVASDYTADFRGATGNGRARPEEARAVQPCPQPATGVFLSL